MKKLSFIKDKKEAGFTLVELTVASALLAGLLLIIAQLYTTTFRASLEDIAIRDANVNARVIMNDINNTARVSDHVVVTTNSSHPPTTNNQICFFKGSQLTQYFNIYKGSAANTNTQSIIYKQIKTVNLSGHNFNGSAATDYPSFCQPINNSATDDIAVMSNGNVNIANQNRSTLGVAYLQASAPSPYDFISYSVGIITNIALEDTNTSSATYLNCLPKTQTYCTVTSVSGNVSLRLNQNFGL